VTKQTGDTPLMKTHDKNIFQLSSVSEVNDTLAEILHKGAREMLAQAVESEVLEFLAEHQGIRDAKGRRQVVRNGYLPARSIQTGLGDISVQVPRVRDNSGQMISFTSALLPPYLKRTHSIEELLPWLYLKGISTGSFPEALKALLGANAKGLSPNTISRLKSGWEAEYKAWSQRDLSQVNIVYAWADGIYLKARLADKQCVLVVIGVDETGKKHLLAIEDGYRESTQSWRDLLLSLKQRGLQIAPKIAVGDGALGFWAALSEVFPDTQHQRCWVHKTANVLNKLPKALHEKAKHDIHQIWMADTRKNAEKALNHFTQKYEAKYPKATNCLLKDKNELLTFYSFPAEHWHHLRTSNPIESTFATIRLRTRTTRGCLSQKTGLAMLFKLAMSAEKRWSRLRGSKLVAEVVNGVQFKDGERVYEHAA
jgi:putative transposase